METIDCADVRDGEMVTRYLDDRLSGSEAEAFEAHYFACEACWGAVEAAMALRATAGGEREPPARPSSRAAPAAEGKPGWRRWIPAAAAAVVAVGVGVWLSGPGGAPDRGAASAGGTFRGEIATFRFDASTLPTGTLEATWPTTPGADLYRVHLFDAEGELLTRRETADTTARVALPATDLPEAGGRGPLYLEIQALDPLRNVIARSGPERIRTGGGR